MCQSKTKRKGNNKTARGRLAVKRGWWGGYMLKKQLNYMRSIEGQFFHIRMGDLEKGRGVLRTSRDNLPEL